MKTFKYIAAGLLVSVIFAANSFASVTVHNKLKDEVIIRTDGLMQADKDAEKADMILYIKPKQKATFELWKNPYNQKRNIFEDKLNTYIDWPSAPWKIVFLDGTISKSSSDKMNGNDLLNDKSYEITKNNEGYIFKEIKRPGAGRAGIRAVEKAVVAIKTKEVLSESEKSLQEMFDHPEHYSSDVQNTLKVLLNKVPAYAKENPAHYLYNLNSINLQSKHIVDLSPFAYLTNLDELALDDNDIVDVKPLSYLKKLQRLSLSSNPVRDFAPLADLPNLTDLIFNGFRDEDNIGSTEDAIKSLASLSHLTSLQIGSKSKNLKDISPLASLTNLEHLRISFNTIKNIQPLAQLHKLISLEAQVNDIEDISPLAGLQNLETLFISSNPIKDFKPLENLKNLKKVDIR